MTNRHIAVENIVEIDKQVDSLIEMYREILTKTNDEVHAATAMLVLLETCPGMRGLLALAIHRLATGH